MIIKNTNKFSIKVGKRFSNVGHFHESEHKKRST